MNVQTRYTYTALVLSAAITAAVVFVASNSKTTAQSDVQNLPNSSVLNTTDVALGDVAGSTIPTIKSDPKLLMPISIGLARVTKKTFGLKISPDDSPVQPEIFSGYHTGIDFETNADEQDTNVLITAACEGDVLLKTWAKGYGGVLVTGCKIDGEDVTVIYGHLKLESITAILGQTLLAGDNIGYLGQGESVETDGRRKHLHFDIHKGTDINILGYVKTQDDLADWIDPIKYLE
jgi:murein DD-endopeptidase MepM/ murein hydrolase activator NlpD